MSNEILTILSGAAPISEVRGAIPLAIFAFSFTPLKAYLLALLGNFLPIIPVLFGLHRFSDYLMSHSYVVNRFLSWLFKYTRDRHAAKFVQYEQTHHHHHWLEFWKYFALFVFVATPLPLTGVWSGALVAFVFGFSFWKSVIALSLGVVASGVVVLSISLGLKVF